MVRMMIFFLFFFSMLNIDLSRAEPVTGLLHHQVEVALDPARHFLEGRDTVRIPDVAALEQIGFWLHANLEIIAAEPPVHPVANVGADPSHLRRYTIDLPGDNRGPLMLTLHYQGTIHHPLTAQAKSYRGGHETTPGHISDKGVFLADGSGWVPEFAESLVTYDLSVSVPPGWQVVSQGSRERVPGVTPESQFLTRWHVAQPTDELHLIAAPWIEYASQADGVELMVFLREADPALAERFLALARHYLRRYAALLGPYPYPKFAVVENFWESGYGMPSFTLLGSRVLRLPFILETSYPHEILHNWWGNGVFVNLQEGNWSEGLTAYLADHHGREEKGKAWLFRRQALGKLTSFVQDDNDFPLNRFLGRHDNVSQAVGYDKAMMFFHMLRQEMGDKLFLAGLQRFFRDNRFRKASYTDLRQAFDAVTGRHFEDFFQQWLTRTGIPTLSLVQAKVTRTANQRQQLTLTLAQTPPALQWTVPVAITLAGVDAIRMEKIRFTELEQNFVWEFAQTPLRLDVDPRFDLLRRLHAAEQPPTLSRAFAARNSLILHEGDEDQSLLPVIQEVGKQWGVSVSITSGQILESGKREPPLTAEKREPVLESGKGEPVLVSEKGEQISLPSEGVVWLTGTSSRFDPLLTKTLDQLGVILEADKVRIAGQSYSRHDHSLVLVLTHPGQPELTLVRVLTGTPETWMTLARKIPHYGPYGYLVFRGAEVTNLVKGEWPSLHFPLSRAFTVAGEALPVSTPLTLPDAPALHE
ncbi:MAG: M1 family peptidase [Magnetococcales bacterium]|nr:M1 family peptidase [Magnetococcales bacterium]